jgi:lipopolysaccharide/colanic/teichoic acid biosynthesis glycosyltransferase
VRTHFPENLDSATSVYSHPIGCRGEIAPSLDSSASAGSPRPAKQVKGVRAMEIFSRRIVWRFLAGVQRLVEIVVAVVVLIVTSPIMLVVAIVIKLDSPGPALFCQERVGLHGRLIMFWKFRTMYADAKERYPEMYSYKYTPEEIRWVCLKQPDDPRVTRVGIWLRKSTLDELPNFWNLLKGDVTIVGPRPDIAEALPYFKPAQKIKFSVKPGITGLAQTRGRGRLRFQDQIRYDMFYAKKKSFWMDVDIILRTIKLIFKSDGAF